MLLKPYKFQECAINSIFDYFGKNQTGNPIVAMPTGTGKSVVIAAFLYEVMTKYRGQRILILTHRKELIEQDYLELLSMWPTAPAGIYSAGLKRKDIEFPIIFCGIGSVYKQAERFGKIDLIIIDEAHLVSPRQETMYQFFINELSKNNGYLRIIGLSATYWRIGHGLLTENHIFTDLCFNMTDMKSFNWLIDNGFLCPLIPFKTNLQIDISKVGMQSGEYKLKDLQIAVDKDEITYRALSEIVETQNGRNHWMIFTTGIDHTEHVASVLNDIFGVPTTAVHSKLNDGERDQRISDYKNGRYTAVVNNNVLTTGFNFKAIDLIGVLRHTMSSALWVQMLGRGTRIFLGKENCIVYDFADNTKRLGPINDPVIPPSPKEKKKGGTAPVKVCMCCNVYNHASARICINCKEPFPENVRFTDEASERELIKREIPEPPVIETFDINHITYSVHHKLERPDTLKVTYYCGNGMTIFNEYLGFEAVPYIRKKAHEWWTLRTDEEIPQSANDAIIRTNELKEPLRIVVWTNKKFPEILGYEFD